jgi:serine/threonine protein kinase/TolB-like protein/Tfp pilus assembly protein PilF
MESTADYAEDTNIGNTDFGSVRPAEVHSAETTNVTRLCRRCGGKLFARTPQGVCSVCLFKTALSVLTESVVPQEPDDWDSVGSAGILREFDDYELLEEIGRGGQGIVYRARQKSLDRTVALKVIGLGPAYMGATNAHLKRFRLEAKAAASLNHPFIVPIHEIGERDGCCYFSMSLVEGGQLDEVVKRKAMPVRRAAELIAKLARTVHYAHEQGILHRDIKPGNILLDTKGEPHLTDFGLARLTQTESDVTRTTEVLGTPSYMAPEQARGNPVQGVAVSSAAVASARAASPPKAASLATATDVYGLGAVLYHLLTGHPPFVGGTTYETTRLLLETEPRQPWLLNPKVDRDLGTICLKCLEKDPQRRYSSALALGEDLERWLRHEPIRARRTGLFTRGRKWLHRNPTTAALMASLVALVAAVSLIVWKSELIGRPTTTGIAVLPFENLSSDREDAFFADGIQDDLLTKLANIADLKVISRTSVMQYRGERNTRQIGEALRVSHVLEGSVRKTGAWLHINAQLIDTRTDTHVWAEEYDRDLKDVFAIQSEIAQKVAKQLHAKISVAETVAIERPPTADLAAFDLYSRAKNLLLTANFSSSAKVNLLQAADLLNQAVTHDPSFFQAYCQLAHTHDRLYFLGHDHTPARLALAEAAVKAAFRLRPDAGETHLACAENLYRGYLDYDGALAELATASRSLPNDPQVFELKGYIERRQGKQEKALRSLERAGDLDPRNLLTLQQIAISYGVLRRHAEEKLAWDRVLAIEPNDIETKVARAVVELDWKADPQPLHQLIDEIRAKNPAAIQSVSDSWLVCALAERDATAAANALVALRENTFGNDSVEFSRSFGEGLIDRMAKDDSKARSAFIAARLEQEKTVQAQPNYGPPLCVLGLIDAALGRKEEALREGRRAVELLPLEKDAVNGPLMIAYSAMIAAWVGDKDLACEQLATAVRCRSTLSYGQLKLLPFWDPLRGDPRFEKIVVSLAPKEK